MKSVQLAFFLLLFLIEQGVRGGKAPRKAKVAAKASRSADRSRGKRKLLRFFDLPSDDGDRQLIAGAAGGPGKDGGITTKDGLKIAFPPLPQPMKSPITINTPAAAYPTIVTDPKQQKPIVLVHEILEPRIKKRLIVHHRTPFLDQYSRMAHTMNPYYMQMAQQNPYYANFAAASPAFQKMTTSPEFGPAFLQAAPYFPAPKKRGGRRRMQGVI